MINDGKPFEQRVEKNFKKYGICYDRIHDQMSGLKGSTNICDYIAYLYPNIYYIECKSCSADKFNMLSMIRENQWKGLLDKDIIPGTRAGYLVWMSKYKQLYWLSAFSADIWYKSGIKSLSIEDFNRIGIKIPELSSNFQNHCDIIRTIANHEH